MDEYVCACDYVIFNMMIIYCDCCIIWICFYLSLDELYPIRGVGFLFNVKIHFLLFIDCFENSKL